MTCGLFCMVCPPVEVSAAIDRHGVHAARPGDVAAEALARLFADHPRQLRLARQQFVEIDDVERQQRAWLCRGDRGVARVAGQQRQLAEELPRSEVERSRLQLHLNLAL